MSSLQFFPYILLLVAVLMYAPALFWRFCAAPLLQSDLAFIMEELDRCYNRAVTLAKRMATAEQPSADRLQHFTANRVGRMHFIVWEHGKKLPISGITVASTGLTVCLPANP